MPLKQRIGHLTGVSVPVSCPESWFLTPDGINKQRKGLKDTHRGEHISGLRQRWHTEDASSCPVELWTMAKN